MFSISHLLRISSKGIFETFYYYLNLSFKKGGSTGGALQRNYAIKEKCQLVIFVG